MKFENPTPHTHSHSNIWNVFIFDQMKFEDKILHCFFNIFFLEFLNLIKKNDDVNTFCIVQKHYKGRTYNKCKWWKIKLLNNLNFFPPKRFFMNWISLSIFIHFHSCYLLNCEKSRDYNRHSFDELKNKNRKTNTTHTWYSTM